MKFKMKRDRFSGGRMLRVECDKGDELDYAEAERVQRGDLTAFLPFDYEKGAKQYGFSYRLGECASLSELMKEPFPAGRLRSLLLSVLEMVRQCEENDLSRRRVVFDADHVFFEPAFQALRFAYVPMRSYSGAMGEVGLLVLVCESAQVHGLEAELASSTLDYARRTPMLTSVAFREFLKGHGLLSPDSNQGFVYEPSDSTDALDARMAFGWDFVKSGSASGSAGDAAGSEMMLKRLSTGESLKLRDGRYTLGRSASCAISFEGVPGLSREHALLVVGGDAVTLRDLGSTNGVFVNGARIEPNVDVPLRAGDGFSLARERFELR